MKSSKFAPISDVFRSIMWTLLRFSILKAWLAVQYILFLNGNCEVGQGYLQTFVGGPPVTQILYRQ